MVWPLGLKKPGLTDLGVVTGVTKFRMVSGGLKRIVEKHFKILPVTKQKSKIEIRINHPEIFF